jgi:hypothetical protein
VTSSRRRTSSTATRSPAQQENHHRPERDEEVKDFLKVWSWFGFLLVPVMVWWASRAGVYFSSPELLILLGLFALGLYLQAAPLVSTLVRDPTAAARALTKLAVAVGGRKRAWRAAEWAADLATGGDPGSPPSTRARMRHSAGLVVAAVRWRVGDLLRRLGRMLDWTLAEPRTEVLVVVATLCTAGYFWRTQGLAGLMSNFENVLATAVLTSGPALWLRKHRAVPPARRGKREATRR